eukprot:scaffold179_cov118-Isochrysis_galbana.AAC.3
MKGSQTLEEIGLLARLPVSRSLLPAAFPSRRRAALSRCRRPPREERRGLGRMSAQRRPATRRSPRGSGPSGCRWSDSASRAPNNARQACGGGRPAQTASSSLLIARASPAPTSREACRAACAARVRSSVTPIAAPSASAGAPSGALSRHNRSTRAAPRSAGTRLVASRSAPGSRTSASIAPKASTSVEKRSSPAEY